MSGRYKTSEGDWTCPDAKCGNVNFARRQQCNRCGIDRNEMPAGTNFKKGGHEIGKAMAEKSKGLFSADDWQCKTCGNVNWARRMTCNMCNAPKFGKVEQRTGYGGGYMEREEIVEYKDRRDSDDDEYDEFGRKKKKFRGENSLSRQLSSEPALATKDEEEDDDEEGDTSKYNLDTDDDDEDDGDLSKYDLDDSDDDNKSADKSKKDKPSRSRSSSRSRRSRSSSRSSRSYSSSSSSRSRSRSSSRSRSKSRERNSRKRSHSRSRSRSKDRSSGSKRQRSRSSSSGREGSRRSQLH